MTENEFWYAGAALISFVAFLWSTVWAFRRIYEDEVRACSLLLEAGTELSYRDAVFAYWDRTVYRVLVLSPSGNPVVEEEWRAVSEAAERYLYYRSSL